MIERFLNAKHWQLFLLTFGIPIVFQIVFMSSMLSNFATTASPDPEEMLNSMKLFSIVMVLVMVLFMATFFGWFWSVAIGLQKKVPEEVRMKVKKFKIFFFIPLVYILSMMLFVLYAMTGLMDTDSEPNVGFIGSMFAIIVPLHLFSMFCIFHTLYFVSKTIKTVELQREVNFSDFAGEFFMIWFYPIGIWIVQPRINKLVDSNQL